MTNSEEGDEYVAGEFAGCEEPEINLERMERYGREAEERLKREDPTLWQKLQARKEKARKARETAIS